MSDKTQERYFVVSESELETLVNTAREFEYANSQRQAGGRRPFKKAEAACRAREVYPVFAHEGVASWVGVKK